MDERFRVVNGADWFARYKFCQPLGQGGMGTVYLAEDRVNQGVQCVIKQLTNKYSDPEEQMEAVRLFQREAAILRNLNHPGIVRIFDDHATEDGRYFLVMDYVPGKNLEVMVKTGGPFSSEMVVQMAIQCCEVLEYLHGQDPPVIYRDLKPSNLMLTPDGRIVLIDFGIARSFTPKEAATRVVTAGYSPPEQYFGKPETRSDLYALGATMCHLLTGQRPRPLNVSAPGLIVSGVLDSLDALCRKLTAHDPADRPLTAMTVRYELYRIYKEIHPDFVVPAEPGTAAGLDDRPAELPYEVKPLGKAFVRARAGALAAAPDPRPEPRPEQALANQRKTIKDIDPPPRPSIWQRVKQWFEIMMH